MNFANKLLLPVFLVLSCQVAAQRLDLTADSSYAFPLPQGKYAVVEPTSKQNISWYDAQGIVSGTLHLGWDIDHAFALAGDLMVFASLDKKSSAAARHEAVLMQGDKLVARFSDVKNIHPIPGAQAFAIEQLQPANDGDTMLKIIDFTGRLLKTAVIPHSTLYSMVSISPELDKIILSPASADQSSVSELTVYSADGVATETIYSFENKPIYEAFPLKNGLVFINVDRKLRVMSGTETKMLLPDNTVDFSFDALERSSDPAYLLGRENSGRFMVLDATGHMVFCSDEANEAFRKLYPAYSLQQLVTTGAIVDIQDGTVIIRNAGDYISDGASKIKFPPAGQIFLIPLQDGKSVQKISSDGVVLAVNIADGSAITSSQSKGLQIQKWSLR